MISVASLWLPIVLSAVAVFFASFLAWMVLPHHKPDFRKLPDEPGFAEAIRRFGLTPGLYVFPFCTPQEMKTEEGKSRYAAGPWGNMMLMGAQPNMGKSLLFVFIFYLVVGVFVAYLAKFALGTGEPFRAVFRFTTTVAVAAYCLGGIPHGLFMGRTFRSVAMDVIDGLVYGAITGLIFAALWPSAGA